MEIDFRETTDKSVLAPFVSDENTRTLENTENKLETRFFYYLLLKHGDWLHNSNIIEYNTVGDDRL